MIDSNHMGNTSRYCNSSAHLRINNVFFALCKNIDTPVSLGMWLRWKYGEFLQLAQTNIDPSGYHDSLFLGSNPVWKYQNDYLVVEYLSKYKGLRTGLDTCQEALQSFGRSEETCRQTNARWRSFLRGKTSRFESVIYRTQRKIGMILGDISLIRESDCGWGPGSTFSLRGKNANLVDKLREKQISVTPNCLAIAQTLIGRDIHWCQARGIPSEGPCTLLPSEFQVVRGNRLTTVPKNAKTDRVIAMEPTANIFLQKALGSHIRRRLSLVGVHLNDQRHNQSAAKRAYRDQLATVDLKSASDTISCEVVRQLLPDEWFLLFDTLRSHEYLIKDTEWRRYSKFSSMGNGFTFELESLLFYSLVCSVCEELHLSCEDVSVYGDDIIAPSQCLPLLIDCLDCFGFETNVKKTHYNSGFRESCGRHYMYGVDVTPIYQKEVPNVLAEVYRLANRIRRLAYRNGSGAVSLRLYRSAWLAAFNGLDPKHFVSVTSEEDTGLAVSRDDLLFLEKPIWVYGSKVACLVFQPRLKNVDNLPLYAYWIRFSPSEPFEGKLGIRADGRYVIRKRRSYQAPIDAPWV